MPRYVTQLGESFCCPYRIFFLSEKLLGHTKTFGAVAKEWLMKCKNFFYTTDIKNVSGYWK
jgi:hypothetical protein